MLSIWFGGDNTAPSTSTQQFHHLTPCFTDSWSSTENQRQNVISEAITITKFVLYMDTAPGTLGSGKSWTFTIRVNGVDSGITITISETATTATWTGSIGFNAGDLLDVSATPTGTPASSTNNHWQISYQTTGQNFLVLGASSSTMPNGATNYSTPCGATGTSWSTTATDFEVVCPMNATLVALAAATSDGAPGTAASGKQVAISVRRNNSTDDLTATLFETAQYALATGSIAWSPGDTYVIEEVPTSTPTARRGSWCMSFTPAVDGETMYGFGSVAAPSASATNFEQMMGNGNAGWNSSESVRLNKPPNVSFKKLYVKLGSAPGLTTSRTITVRDNGADTTLAVTIADLNTTGNDTTHTITMSGGGNTGSLKSTVSGAVAIDTGGVHVGYVMAVTQPAALPNKLIEINQAVMRANNY